MTLDQWLTQQGKTLKAFGDEIGIDRATVHRWAKGKRTPSAQQIGTIEQLTGGSVTFRDWVPSPAPVEQAA